MLCYIAEGVGVFWCFKDWKSCSHSQLVYTKHVTGGGGAVCGCKGAVLVFHYNTMVEKCYFNTLPVVLRQSDSMQNKKHEFNP